MPPTPHPLPEVVMGMNLRPVSDARRGYGTATARRTLQRLGELGANTVGVLLEGRLAHPRDPEVMAPDRATLDATRRALVDAHALGFATVLVPHLYVDDGTWRGELAFPAPADANVFWRTYGGFIESAARMAETAGASVLSIGVELKAMSASEATAARMRALAHRVREVYGGLLTYSANWDEAEGVAFWGAVDLAGVNGYYPLEPTPARGAEALARRLRALSERAGRPVIVLEVGYRSSPLSHLRPWEWPEQVDPAIDEGAQADAWAAVLTHWLGAPGVRGLLGWVVPTDPDDPASEPRHGFNPLNKAAERVIAAGFGRRAGGGAGQPPRTTAR